MLIKKKLPSCRFCHSGEPQSENKGKRKNRQIPEPCERTEKAVEDEINDDTNCNWRTWIGPKKLGRKKWSDWKSEEESSLSRLLRSSRILRRVLVTWGDLSSNSSKRPTGNAGVKNSQEWNSNNNSNKNKFIIIIVIKMKTLEHEGDDYTNRDLCFRYSN